MTTEPASTPPTDDDIAALRRIHESGTRRLYPGERLLLMHANGRCMRELVAIIQPAAGGAS